VTEHTLASLSATSGVAPRTIRYYQSLGLLPKPQRHGKQAVYGPEHESRLQLILEMQARGLQLNAIRDVIHADTATRTSVAEWLGLETLRDGHWATAEVTRRLSDAELGDLLGDRRDEILTDLIVENFVYFADGAWVVPDLPLLKGALDSYDAGGGIALSAAMIRLVRRRLSALAEEVVDLVGREYGPAKSPEELWLLMEHGAGPPIAALTAHVALQEFERVVRKRSTRPAESGQAKP